MMIEWAVIVMAVTAVCLVADRLLNGRGLNE